MMETLCYECNAGHGPNEMHAFRCPNYVPPNTGPTETQLLLALREEWEALGLLSYHGAAWGWAPDLDKDDIAKIRGLIRDAAATIESYLLRKGPL